MKRHYLHDWGLGGRSPISQNNQRKPVFPYLEELRHVSKCGTKEVYGGCEGHSYLYMPQDLDDSKKKKREKGGKMLKN